MALPPTIPTSFVPHPGGASQQRYRMDMGGAFGFFAFGLLGLSLLLAVGVFLYGQVLSAQKAADDKALAKAEAAIDPATVAQFVQLRDRLSSSATLLNTHLAYSNFFTLLGTVLPSTVRITSLHLSTDDTNVTTIDGTGLAKSFNALAATSDALAKDGHIKDAIFSGITINKSGSVSFTITATVDPKLVAYAPQVALTPAAVATTTPATATTTGAVGTSTP